MPLPKYQYITTSRMNNNSNVNVRGGGNGNGNNNNNQAINLLFAAYPPPPLWSNEEQAMIVLWIAREHHMFEMEMRELEYLLGLRALKDPGASKDPGVPRVGLSSCMDWTNIRCTFTKYSKYSIDSFELVLPGGGQLYQRSLLEHRHKGRQFKMVTGPVWH
ncbi:hypothetical protein BDR05DRAFT_949775 [Suillus weaverae]|nr:hypothetical protein BDR05DRAFT_949775 [Suillus weaverae]